GRGTFIDELIGLANGVNIAGSSSTSYPLLSREEILRRKPQTIIVTHEVAGSIDHVASAFPEWESLPAIRDRQIAIVDANLITRPGPRIIKGLGRLMIAIHAPENARLHTDPSGPAR
ncbi:MAG: ABC transporter substrate-binding protein, partial [Bacteroidota bacterium]